MRRGDPPLFFEKRGPQGERKIARLLEAAHARRLMCQAFFGTIPDILMFDVPPPLQSKGIDAYQRTWDVFFSWSHDPVVFDITEMSVTAGGEVAFAAAVMRCSGREPSGEDIELEFRLTIGLRKIAGQWIVMHEHRSIPRSQLNFFRIDGYTRICDSYT